MRLALNATVAGVVVGAALALPGAAAAALLPTETLSPSTDPNGYPELNVSPGGAMVTAWSSETGVVTATYRPAGKATDTDAVESASMTNTGNERSAINDAGDAIVVFEADVPGDHYSRVYAVTRSAGDSAWSAPQKISDVESEEGISPDVAIDGDGNALIVFNGGHNGGPVRSTYRHADGTLEPSQLITGVGGASVAGYAPKVALDGAGRATVAFANQSVTVATRSAGPAGTYAPASVVDSGSYYFISSLWVDANAAGDAMVGWVHRLDSWETELRTVHRDALGMGFSAVKTAGGNYDWGMGPAGVGLDAAGDAVALWYGQGLSADAEGTEGAFYDSATGTWTTDTSVDQALHANDLRVAVSDNGEAVATWYESVAPGKVKMMRRGAGQSGTWGTPVSVADTAYSVGRPRVGMDDQGSAAVLWMSQEGSNDPRFLQLRIDDRAAPTAGAISVPATAQLGETVAMSAAFADRHSAVSVDWALGDGDTAAGASVEHAYDELGEQTVTITGTDAAGNAAAPVTRTIEVVDTTSPETSITAPEGATNDDPVTLTFGGTDNSDGTLTFACSIDGAAAEPCSSPAQLNGLGEGEHTVTVAATDASGNSDGTPASTTFTVDRTGPDTMMSGPAGPTNATAPQVQFWSDDDDATFECSRDGGTFAGCASPVTLDDLAEGSHTFAVRATDAADNTDATPTQTTIVIDRTAPSPAIATPANGGDTTDTTPVLSGSGGRAAGDDPVVYYGVWSGTDQMADPLAHGEATVASNGTWSVTLPTLALGTYTASVCQYDHAVNYRYPCPKVTFEVVAPTTAPVGVQQQAPTPHSTPTPPVTTPGTSPAPKVTVGQAIAQGSTAYSGAFARLGISGLLSRPVPPLPFLAPGPGKAQVDLLAPTAKASAAAAKRKKKAKPVVVATGAKTLTAAGQTQIRVKLTAKGRKLLKKSKSIRLTLKTSFTPKGGKVTSVSRKVTLKKKK